MAVAYRIDPRQCRFSVQAFATGMLSFVGHSPTFAVHDFSGTIRSETDEIQGMKLELTINADSLVLENRFSASDRAEIEDRMRREVLETARYPEIVYRASPLSVEATARGRFRVRLNGPLSLHGMTHTYQTDAELFVYVDGVELRGSCPLRMSDYRIRPVTALGGAIKLKDDVRISFDLNGVPESL
jgi:polyisoprenoid-binding protein YceI